MLADALTAEPPSFPVWLDCRELRPGDGWDPAHPPIVANDDLPLSRNRVRIARPLNYPL